jgi:manganese transport protein
MNHKALYDQSLSEVHGSVDTTLTAKPLWKRAFAFFGPAYLVSVGYMDPGNWATDLAGGSQFGYKLIWVLLMSNLMALLLQSLAARLGIVRGRDLAQANRETYPAVINFILYILAEIAIAACDLAEVLGMAIGIQLLTGIPLLWAVLVTVLDTFLLLLLQRLGMRKMEAFIITLIGIIGVSFLIEIVLAKPNLVQIAGGFIPSIPNNRALYIAIGIIGATVMPHNLYLHSALVQTRKIKRDEHGIKKALRLNFLDSVIALNMAFFVNAAILILAASVFFYKGRTDIAEIRQAHQLLQDMLGNRFAPLLFAVALIAAGQSSTITGTLAGQIVMEGYLRLRINPWMRRLLTRLLAIIPAVIVILIRGENDIDSLLVLSQVILSLQLGFAMIPLIHFVSDKKTMSGFAIKPIVKLIAWTITGVLVYLNLRMVQEQAADFFMHSGSLLWKSVIILSAVGYVGLLLATIFYPLILKYRTVASAKMHESSRQVQGIAVPSYRRIAVALDFSINDYLLIAHAVSQSKPETTLLLLHVVESASAKLLGAESLDYETLSDQEKLDEYVRLLKEKGVEAASYLGYRSRSKELARLITESRADLLVIGAHGHKGLKDWFYGETINSLRHRINIPILIVQAQATV